ncbi:MAG TPA: hypothetical protein VFA88_03230 [Gaiellaceae bacterium]|nr:hypothetical protein [Gaiellaceae bacterium]
MGDRRWRQSLRRRGHGGALGAALTAALVVGSLTSAAFGARTLEPDPSPPRSLAPGGLQPDAFSAAGVGAAHVVAGAPALAPRPAHARAVRVELPPPRSSGTVPIAPPTSPPSAPARRVAVAPARQHTAGARRPQHRPARPPEPRLLALGTGRASASPGAALAPAVPVAAVARVATLAAPASEYGQLLPAALALLVLVLASGGLVGLAYRLHRERIEV